MDEPNGTWKPPYFAFQTFWTFMADLAAKPLPPKIDRSLLKSKSGTDQANLLLALRAFDLIDADNTVNAANLVPIAQGDEESRAKALGAVVQRYYGKALALSESSGTEGQLHEIFRDEFGLSSADTRRKAVTFFLHAARKAGFELSQHFPSTRSGSGGPGTPRKQAAPKKKAAAKVTAPAVAPIMTQPEARAHTKSVDLESGGRVTVSYDVDLFDLTREDREFVLGLVDALIGYKPKAKPATKRAKPSPESAPTASENADEEPPEA